MRIGVVLGLPLIVLVGCGATDAGPKPTVAPNAIACAKIVTAVQFIPATLNTAENSTDAWEAVRVDFDQIALRADGQVAERVAELVDAWPEAVDIVLWNDYDEFNAALGDIERACQADGADVEIPRLA